MGKATHYVPSIYANYFLFSTTFIFKYLFYPVMAQDSHGIILTRLDATNYKNSSTPSNQVLWSSSS